MYRKCTENAHNKLVYKILIYHRKLSATNNQTLNWPFWTYQQTDTHMPLNILVVM